MRKKCTKCKKEKNRGSFYVRNKSPDKLDLICKECRKEVNKNYKTDAEIWRVSLSFNKEKDAEMIKWLQEEAEGTTFLGKIRKLIKSEMDRK